MKYNQFLELDEILNENNITVDDIKENHEVVNEVIGLGLLGGILAGFGLLFRKALLRWGIKKVYLVKLNNIGKRFERQILNKTSKIAKKSAVLRQRLVGKEKVLRAQETEEAATELESLIQKKQILERRVSKDVNEFITKVSGIQSKEVTERIDELKRLKPSQRTALKKYWEMLIIDIRLNAFNKLINDGIITDEEYISKIKQEFDAEREEAKEDLKNIGKKIKEEVEGEKKEKVEVTFESISQNIDELEKEKLTYEKDRLKRKIILIMRDIRKLEDKEQRVELNEKLIETFGKELMAEISKELRELKGQKEKIEQETLKSEDNL